MSTAFTEREMQIMAYAWQCFTEQPKIDYEKLAGLSGFSNVRSASNAWGAIKKKLAAQAGTDGTETTSNSSPTKATPRKRGKKASDEDGDGEATPASKKTKSRKGKATAKKGKTEADDEGKEDTPVKGEPEEEQDEELS